MTRKWRRDQIQQTWTAKQWNEMTKDATVGKTTGDIGPWNELYNTVKHADDLDVKDWNDIYI